MNLYPQSYGQPIPPPQLHAQSQSPPLGSFGNLSISGGGGAGQQQNGDHQQSQNSARFSNGTGGGWDTKRSSRQALPQSWLDPTREQQEYRNPSPALSPPTSNASGPTSHGQSHQANSYQSYQPYPEPFHAGAMGAIGLANTPSPPPMFSQLPSQSAPNIAYMGMGHGQGISSNVAAVSGGVVNNMNGMPAYGSASLSGISGRQSSQGQQMQGGQGQGQGQGQGAWRAYALPGMPIPDEDVIPTAIVIKNIPFAVPRETLLGVIESLGAPLPYAFNYHHDQGVFRGLAFANFRAPDEAAAVVAALNGYDVSGRKLKVEYKKVLQPGEKDRIEREKALKRMRSVQGFDRDPMGMGMGMSGMGMGQQLSPSASYGGITPSASLGGIGLSTLGSGVNVGQMLPSGSGGLQRSSANGLSINSGIAGVSGATSPVGQQQGQGQYQQIQQQQQQQQGYQQQQPQQQQQYHQQPQGQGQGLATHFEADYSPPPSASSHDSFTGKPSSAHSGGSGNSASASNSSAAADLPTQLDMNDPITLDIYSRVLLFKEDRMRDELAFSRNLSPYERRVVHLVAARLGMTSLTQGDDDNGKYVLVLRQAPSASATGTGSAAAGRPGLTSSASSSSAPQHQGPPASASAAFHGFNGSGNGNGNGNSNSNGLANPPATAHYGQQHQQGSTSGGMLPPNEMTTAALRIKKSMPDLRGFNGPVMSRDPSRSLAPQRSSGNLRAQAQAQGQYGGGQGQDGYASASSGRDSSASTLSPPAGHNANAREFVSLGAAAERRVQINGTPTSMGPPPSPGAGAQGQTGAGAGSYGGGERYGWHSSSSSTSLDQSATSGHGHPARALSAPSPGQSQSQGQQAFKADSIAGSERDGALSPVSASGSYAASIDLQAGSGAGAQNQQQQQQQQQQQANLTRHPRGPSSDSRGFVGVLGSGRGAAANAGQEGEAARTRDSLDV